MLGSGRVRRSKPSDSAYRYMDTMLRIVEIPEQTSGKERPLTPAQDYVKSIELTPGSPIVGKTAPAISPPVSPMLEPGSVPGRKR